MYGNIWNHHNNTFEKDTVIAGIKEHYTDKKLNLNEYILYAGLVQSLMYNYSLESFRSKKNCGGGPIWMFADCWGEVGWSIIDYYLRRKISFYGVKHALAPIKLIMREEYAHAVHIKTRISYKPSDNYFDMLPGEKRNIVIKNGAGCDFEIKTVN